jgi:hypothetical protein
MFPKMKKKTFSKHYRNNKKNITKYNCITENINKKKKNQKHQMKHIVP